MGERQKSGLRRSSLPEAVGGGQMGGVGMEKRVAGIVRWLERFQRSYKSGAMESALMDAECARADLEILRRDVWSSLGPSREPRRRVGMFLSRAVLSAFLVVLATSVPVSELRRRTEEASPVHDSLFAWTALSVRGSGGAFDEDWGGGNAASHFPLEMSGERKNPSTPRGERANAGLLRRPSSETRERPVKRAPNAAEDERAVRAKAANGKKVPYETVFSLLQTGERVLKNEEPVIAVDRGQGKGEGGL